MIGEEDNSQLKQREFIRFLSGGVLTFAPAPDPAPQDSTGAAEETPLPTVPPPVLAETRESVAQAF